MKSESRLRLRLIFMVMACVFIVVSMLGVVCACEKKSNDDKTDIDSCVSPSQSCKFTYEKDVYDINDVEVTFYCKDIVLQRWWCQDFDPKLCDSLEKYEEGTYEYQKQYEHLLNMYEAYQEQRPQYCDFYYTSFGKKFHIKRITEFEFSGASGDSVWEHRETMKIPSELFVNEYGAIDFSWEIITQNGETFGFSCRMYYKKDGDNIYISREDLKPEYVSYYEEMKAKGAFPDDGKTGGFTTKQDADDYCAVYCKSDQYEDIAKADFYFGSVFDGREFEYVDLYFVNDDETPIEYFVKRIDDYNENEYGVIVDRYFDYEGKEQIAGIRFKHYETIQIPVSITTRENGREGNVFFAIKYKTKGNEETGLIRLRGIHFRHNYQDTFPDSRPYNEIHFSPSVSDMKDGVVIW